MADVTAKAEDKKSEAVQYRNFSVGPVSMFVPSMGEDVSLPGKGRVWLWPTDLSSASIARLIKLGTLKAWKSEDKAPVEMPVETAARLRREGPKVEAKPALDAKPAKGKSQSFAQVISEKQPSAVEPKKFSAEAKPQPEVLESAKK